MNRIMRWTWAAAASLAVVGCTSDGGKSDSGIATEPAETAPDLTITDEFTQTAYNSVSILWVIDPEWTTELEDHKDQMRTFYELLLLHGIPWKVATMKPLSIPESVRGELDNEHQYVDDLDNMGSHYTVFGGGPTHFRSTVHWTMTERYEEYQDFYFAGGHLSIIAFADSRDETPATYLGKQEFITFLKEQDVALTASVSAITTGVPEVRDSWLEYADATGGVVTSSPNEALNLEKVALASLGLTKTFTLTEVPAVAPQQILTTYRGHDERLFIGKDYSFDFLSNAITLKGDAPLANTRITVKYQRRVEGVGDAPRQ